MICHEFKCGIGTASRVVDGDGAEHTLGVLVQANYGMRDSLRIAGVPVGQHLRNDRVYTETRAAANGLDHHRRRHRRAAAAASAQAHRAPRRHGARPHGQLRGQRFGRHFRRLLDRERRLPLAGKTLTAGHVSRQRRSWIRCSSRPCRPRKKRSSTRWSPPATCRGPRVTTRRRSITKRCIAVLKRYGTAGPAALTTDRSRRSPLRVLPRERAVALPRGAQILERRAALALVVEIVARAVAD